MNATAGVPLAGVIGWPVDHSLSPQLHGYWLEKYKIKGAYVPLAVPSHELEQALRTLPGRGFRGANVTVPHKEEAIKVVDQVDASAQRIGAVNTIFVHSDNTLEGRNTDGYGFLQSLREERQNWQVSEGPIGIMGAGGAVRAICVALQDAGAPEIRIINRTFSRAVTIAEEFGEPVIPVLWKDRHEALDGLSLLVNGTSLGMRGKPPLELKLCALPQTALVTDIVYSPLETHLLRTARLRGNPTVDGLGMLLHQARPGFEFWFGRKPEVSAELRQFILAAVQNSG